MKEKLISLCIPTYNRAAILDESTRKMLELDSFDASVELVISDNCSTDSTEEVVRKLQKDFSGKSIIYHKNESNVRDRNFFIALEHGSAKYRKLLNDYTFVTEDGLKTMKKAILDNCSDMDCNLFFCGSMMVPKRKKVCIAHNPDDLVRLVYHHITWISNFGVWDKDLDFIRAYLDTWTTQIMQVHWMLNLSAERSKTILYNFRKLYGRTPMPDSYRLPYNVFNVLAKNYYDTLYSFRDKGLISNHTLHKDKTNSLRTFIGWSIRDLLIRKQDSNYDTEGAWKICWDLFKTCPYFYFIFIKAGIKSFLCLFAKGKH